MSCKLSFEQAVAVSLVLVMACYAHFAFPYVTAEDQKEIEAAGCPDIIREHRNFAAAEKQLAEEIQRNSNSTTAGNVLGLATLAAFGLGFFSWNSQADARKTSRN